MYELALCAGIAGLSRGLQDAGIRTACYVEYNDYRVHVLISRMRDDLLDNAPIWDDVTTFDGKPWRGKVDIISAGFPCQPFSKAGKKRGAADGRYLWPDIYRVICEARPRYIVLENVPGVLTGDPRHGRPAPLSRILSDLAACGYDAEWDVLPAAAFGAPHQRERLFLVGYPAQIGRGRVLCPLAEIGIEAYTAWPPSSNFLDTPGSLIQEMERRTCQPAIFGGNDGTPHRVERLAAVGEAVVRQVAAYVGRCIVSDANKRP